MKPTLTQQIKKLTIESAELLRSGEFAALNNKLIKRQQLLEILAAETESASDERKTELGILLKWVKNQDDAVHSYAIELKSTYQAKMVDQFKTSKALKQYKQNIG